MGTPRSAALVSALAALLLVPAALAAQSTIGIGGGISYADLTGDDAEGFDSKTGFQFSGWWAIPVASRLSIVPGVAYIQKGAKGSESGISVELKLDYVEVPLLLSVALTGEDSPVGFNLFAGPSLAFETTCELKASAGGTSASEDCGEEQERETMDYGALLGAGLTFPAGNIGIFVNGGVDFGLKNLNASQDPGTVKSRAFWGSVGLAFPVGG